MKACLDSTHCSTVDPAVQPLAFEIGMQEFNNCVIIITRIMDYEFLTGSLLKDTAFVRQKLHLFMFGVREEQLMDIAVVVPNTEILCNLGHH